MAFFNNANAWDDLEHPLDSVATKGKAPETFAYPCDLCSGTGKVSKVYGYTSFTKKTYVNKCKACNGRGHFATPIETRERNRTNAAARKVRTVDDCKAVFHSENPGLIEGLRPCAEWSEFARSLVGQFDRKGSLSVNQVASAASMVAKLAANAERRAMEADALAVDVDLSTLADMFATAMANGHKRPKYRAEGLTISMAPAHGRNAGALYVKEGAAYQGKVAAGAYHPTRDAADNTAERLATIAANPRDAAVKYGQQTGACSCCGRTLTNKGSIEAGIGPICAEKWGL